MCLFKVHVYYDDDDDDDDGEGQAGLWGIKKFLIATVSQRRPRCKAVANYRLRNYRGIKEPPIGGDFRFKMFLFLTNANSIEKIDFYFFHNFSHTHNLSTVCSRNSGPSKMKC